MDPQHQHALLMSAEGASSSAEQSKCQWRETTQLIVPTTTDVCAIGKKKKKKNYLIEIISSSSHCEFESPIFAGMARIKLVGGVGGGCLNLDVVVYALNFSMMKRLMNFC